MKYLQNKYLKIVVAVLILAWAVYQFTRGNIGNGIALIFLSLIPILLYFRNEFILLTFLRLRTRLLQLYVRNYLFTKKSYAS